MRAMKDSGIEWIGQIPQEWIASRLKFYAEIDSGEMISKDEFDDNGEFSVIGSNGDIGRTNKCNNTKTVITTGRVGTVGTVQTVDKAWITDNALIIDPKIDVGFLKYVIPNFDFDAMLSGTAQPLITASKLKNQYIPLPSIEAQPRIAQYLDGRCAEIDALIASKEKTNALLRERRQSIIYEAVTKGLNPDAPMKDSGIEWIGMIPAHWEIRRLKIIADMQTGTTPKTTSTECFDGDVNWFTPADFNGEMVIKESERKLSCKAIEDGQAHLFPKNTIMFVGIGATVGKIAFVQVEASCNQQITAVLPKDPERTKYYAYWLASCSSAIKSTANYTTLPIINNQHLGETPCPYVFDVNEQSRITDYLDSKCSEIDNLISANEATIQKLKEYRQSIIYEAVTGKIEI